MSWQTINDCLLLDCGRGFETSCVNTIIRINLFWSTFFKRIRPNFNPCTWSEMEMLFTSVNWTEEWIYLQNQWLTFIPALRLKCKLIQLWTARNKKEFHHFLCLFLLAACSLNKVCISSVWDLLCIVIILVICLHFKCIICYMSSSLLFIYSVLGYQWIY